jgi:HSP20 family molecular chaperone IbpA
MEQNEKMQLADRDRALYELLGVLREPGPPGRWAFARQCKTWRPPTDVYETADCFVVKVEIAGMQRADLNIALEARELTISGIRQDSSAKVAYQQMEVQYGAFESHVSLPAAVDEDSIEATYQEGFLTIRLPKAQARRVSVTYT